MVQLYDKESGARIGAIGDEQMQFLIDQLEEESEKDDDYYINRATLEMFEQRGADPALVKLLSAALGSREDMEIRWSRS